MILGTSGKFEINGLDWQAIGRSTLDGILALAITVLPEFGGATYIVAHHDITPYVAMGIMLLVKTLRKYLTDNTVQ